MNSISPALRPADAPRPAGAFDALKARQRTVWSSGDYASIGVTLQIVGEQLCEAVDLRAGDRVLDVAAGNGNAALAAARRFAQVTAVDYVPALLEACARRAAAEGLPLRCLLGDAEALPFDDASFDVVLSTFGVMFTPDQERAAGELLRVTRPGGRIALASWTPEGFIGELLRTIAHYLPPPAGLRAPVRWGTGPGIEELFAGRARVLQSSSRDYMFRYAGVEHWIERFATCYGPLLKAFETLDPSARQALRADIAQLLLRRNQGGDASLLIPGQYLEVVLLRS